MKAPEDRVLIRDWIRAKVGLKRCLRVKRTVQPFDRAPFVSRDDAAEESFFAPEWEKSQTRRLKWPLGSLVAFVLLTAGIAGWIFIRAKDDLRRHETGQTPATEEAELTAQAKAAVNQFLSADSVDKLECVINYSARSFLADYYQEHPLIPAKANHLDLLVRQFDRRPGGRDLFLLLGEVEGHGKRVFAVEHSGMGLKVHWEHYVAYNPENLRTFLSEGDTEARLFRVQLRASDYFNFAFDDEARYDSYRLRAGRESFLVDAYMDKSNTHAQRLKLVVGEKNKPLTVKLKGSPYSESDQPIAEITELVAETWLGE